LVAINTSSNTVVILLGQGDGTFSALANSPAAGTSPTALAIGDFNGDGIADMAVANGNNGNTVTVLLGVGDGTFSTVSATPTVGTGAFGIVTADFNGDGKVDLAVTAQSSGTLTILLGNGDGTFTEAASPAGNKFCNYITSADLNGDGTPDLVVTCNGWNITQILLGNGDGTFTAAPAFPLPSGVQPFTIVTADFNEDGIADLAIVSGYPNGRLFVFQGNGDGTFTLYPSIIQPGYAPSLLVTADFDGDGRPDLLVPSVRLEPRNIHGYSYGSVRSSDGYGVLL
jgi:hypothetical protein